MKNSKKRWKKGTIRMLNKHQASSKMVDFDTPCRYLQ